MMELIAFLKACLSGGRVNQGPRTVVFKLECLSESPGELVKQTAGLCPHY